MNLIMYNVWQLTTVQPLSTLTEVIKAVALKSNAPLGDGGEARRLQ